MSKHNNRQNTHIDSLKVVESYLREPAPERPGFETKLQAKIENRTARAGIGNHRFRQLGIVAGMAFGLIAILYLIHWQLNPVSTPSESAPALLSQSANEDMELLNLDPQAVEAAYYAEVWDMSHRLESLSQADYYFLLEITSSS